MLFVQGTYQQQQQLLKQQRITAAADSNTAAELESARRDTWIVFVLVEMLGSHLITPVWPAKVKIAQQTHQPQTSAHPPPSSSSSSSGYMHCSWNNGYEYSYDSTAAAAAAGGDSSAATAELRGTSPWQPIGSSSSGGRASVDLLTHCISYPQFVEVLLCVLGGRATVLLEPDVKQLRNIALDDEMKVWEEIIEVEAQSVRCSAFAEC